MYKILLSFSFYLTFTFLFRLTSILFIKPLNWRICFITQKYCSLVKPMTLKLVFTASLLDAQHQRDSGENKPASLFVVLLGKTLGEIPPFCCGR